MIRGTPEGAAAPRTMRAWAVASPGPLDTQPLRQVDRPIPVAGPRQVLVRVSACGVCRTDLHLALGELAPRRPGTVPGHQVVGRVAAVGGDVTGWQVGDRLGIAWLAGTCGRCRWCREGSENLCEGSVYTGWDLDGGFAPYVVADAGYTYRLPAGIDDVTAAPLLCAGIIGYRALRRARVPPGGRLGIYGFGSSAHITAQIAIRQGALVYVMSRGRQARDLAVELGATWVGGPTDAPPTLLDSAIVFAPAGELVPIALGALDAGGTLALAGIHMSTVPPLDYARHLFRERDLRTVTSNTRADGEELLALADHLRLDVRTTVYAFDAVPEALDDVARGRTTGSGVIDLTA
jgi:propanol-preferring alcohol dehydrogenase